MTYPKKVVEKVLTVMKGCGHNLYMTSTDPIFVAIDSDGLGTYQARCLGCSWRGPWRRKQEAAITSAKGHLEHDDVLAASDGAR